ncbi:MAG: hypothetical protein VX346_25655 [Planctomycetota bacterium]|nr:hypothetical protein [Planctomycetota bacterium]
MKVAAIITCMRHRSHAHVILENFLEPYLFNGRVVESGCEIVSMYVDQFPRSDMARDVARQYGIRIYPSIREAVCNGGRRLGVDAVLSIAEHGRYGHTRRGQKRYPRKRFLDEIFEVFQASGRTVPVFNDKHLSYRWDWAEQIYQRSLREGIPLMAGSSVPLAQRDPPLELPRAAEIIEAVSIHGGPVEAYDFHALEVLQSLVESRRGGETGVSRIEFLDAKRLWNAARQGRWSGELAEAAMTAEMGAPPKSLRRIPGERTVPQHGVIIHFVDGLKATMLTVGKSDTRWNFACRVKGKSKIQATALRVGPWRNRNLFKALSHAIQDHFRNARTPYPLERTLLTTGLVESIMHARETPGVELATPHLEFAYRARKFSALRECGASWQKITDETPEPRGITGYPYD